MRIEKKILRVLDGNELTLAEMAEELIIPPGRLFHTLVKLERRGVLMRTGIDGESAGLPDEDNIDSYLWSRGN